MKLSAISLLLWCFFSSICFAQSSGATPGTNPEQPAGTPPPAGAPGSVAFLDFKNGFLNFKFEDPISNYSPPSTYKTRDGGPVKIYDFSSNVTKIGDTEVKQFIVICLEDRIAGVAAIIDDNRWNQQIRKVIVAAYGQGKLAWNAPDYYDELVGKSAASPDSVYKWKGIKANCELRNYRDSKEILILAFNNALQDKLSKLQGTFIVKTATGL